VPLPFAIPLTDVFIVIAGVVVAVATVPPNPFAEVTDAEVTVPELTDSTFQAVPLKKLKRLVLVLKITSPVAGVVIASLCAVVILGGRKPADVDLNSKIEEASGVIEVVLIPTCANVSAAYINIQEARQNTFLKLYKSDKWFNEKKPILLHVINLKNKPKVDVITSTLFFEQNNICISKWEKTPLKRIQLVHIVYTYRKTSIHHRPLLQLLKLDSHLSHIVFIGDSYAKVGFNNIVFTYNNWFVGSVYGICNGFCNHCNTCGYRKRR
jgi:hypothetical protein